MTRVNSTALPQGYSDLQPFSAWILETEQARNTKRLSSSLENIREFYDAMHRALPSIQQTLAGFSTSDLPEPERNLMLMTKSLMEISACIELFSSVEVPFAVASERLHIQQ